MTPGALQMTAEADKKNNDDEVMNQAEEEPITKLEIDKSKRKLTFADCEPGEEIEAVMAENERMAAGEDSEVESLLDRVCVPSQIQNKMTAVAKET